MNAFEKMLETLPGHWHQGSLSDKKGNYCVVGHLRKALGLNTISGWPLDALEAVDFLETKIVEMYPDRPSAGWDPVPAFNDHPDTTEEDVIAVVEKAAIGWEERI